MFIALLPENKLIEYYTPDSKPYNLSYGQWTVKWWQWLSAIPTNINPAADETGENAPINQLDPNVWFLAGTVGGEPVERKCLIPSGRSILFPVINYEMNPIEKPELKTVSELVRHVIEDQDDIIHLDAIVDGQKIPIYRVRPEPTMFTITVPFDNPLQMPGGGITQATADGFWVFLKPLPLGEHHIYFSGSCSAGTRRIKASYNIVAVSENHTIYSAS
jgi:hypothetical protein